VHAHVELSRDCALLCVWLSARLPADERLTQMHLNFMRQNNLWQASVEREEKFVKVAEARHVASPLSSQASFLLSVKMSYCVNRHLKTSAAVKFIPPAWQSS
jgi:hypothetical protein